MGTFIYLCRSSWTWEIIPRMRRDTAVSNSGSAVYRKLIT